MPELSREDHGKQGFCSICGWHGDYCKCVRLPTKPRKIKHTVNGDQGYGWYCYACRFWTNNVEEAAQHDGTFTEESNEN